MLQFLREGFPKDIYFISALIFCLMYGSIMPVWSIALFPLNVSLFSWEYCWRSKVTN